MSGKERWKWVVGYEGFYEVSDQGRVRSVDRVVPHKGYGTIKLKGRIKKLIPNGKLRYLVVNLSKEGIERLVHTHRLVMAAWVGPCPDGQQVRHGPKGRLDNSVSNLCYGTRVEDSLDKRRDGTHCGKAVKRSDGVEFISLAVAAEESGCWASSISRVCKGKHKRAGGFGWEYI